MISPYKIFTFNDFQNTLLFMDDFEGDQVKDEWTVTVAGGSIAVVDGETGGVVRLTTTASNDNVSYLDWNDIKSLLFSKKFIVESRFKLASTTDTYFNFYPRESASQYISIKYDTDTDSNWMIQARDGGDRTLEDSGVTPDTNYHIYRIEVHTHGSNHVHYYIDGVECANSPISSNVPDGYFQPRIYLLTRTTTVKTVDVDYVYVTQER